jgi:hypothetical protein
MQDSFFSEFDNMLFCADSLQNKLERNMYGFKIHNCTGSKLAGHILFHQKTGYDKQSSLLNKQSSLFIC